MAATTFKRSATGKALRLLLWLALLCSAFLLYSVMKIKGMPSLHFPLEPQNRESSLYRHVEELSVKIGSRSLFEHDRLEATKQYLLASLTGMGHSPTRQDFSYQRRTYSNIIVTVPGKEPRKGIVLIGAHYDTVAGTPGADDNASAVAVLLEMCRLLKDCSPELEIRLVFFTLEEPPVFRTDFMGSAVYARQAREKGEPIAAMICLEMVGYYSDQKGSQSYPLPLMGLLYPATPDFIAVVGNLSSRGLVKRVADSLRKSGGVSVETLATVPFLPGVDFSDHRSFWEQGYPAVMVTDTAFYRNPGYHTPQDTIDTLDFRRMSLLLRGLVQTAKELAGGGLPLPPVAPPPDPPRR